MNKIIIELSYGLSLVLDHADGIKILEALKNAEIFNKNYDKPDIVRPLGRKDFCANFISEAEYKEAKLAASIIEEQLCINLV